ncbi:MAG: glycosyltransferase family 4 protein [Patescibacteria group bacterium]
MKKVTRVLVFSTDDHLYPAGGAEQAFGNISERLPHIEFDLISARLRPSAKRFETVKNVHIYRIGFGIPRVDGILLALFGHLVAHQLMKKHTYDLIWSIMASYGAFAAVRVKRQTKLPFLLTLQEGDSFEHIYSRVRLVRRAFNNIFKTADGVQAISHYLMKWGRDMGYKGSAGKVIPNGVAIEAFTKTYSPDEIKEARASFGFPAANTILITSSRLEKKNGIGDVVTALPLLPKDVCFVVCGSGSLEAEIKQQVSELGVADRVRFLGFVEPRKLPLLLQASDIFIRPSHTEGLGNAFLEAMAAGLLTVGTRAGGIPDFLTDRETGFMVEIGSRESIAGTINAIRTLDGGEIARIKSKAKRMVIDIYNWEKVSREMELFFEELTSV